MSNSKTNGRKTTIREYLRVLFANIRLLLLFVLLGAALGWTRSAFQERTYRGQVELATLGREQIGSLPDPTELRRLALSDEALTMLMPTWAGPEAQKQMKIQEAIDISPVVQDAQGQNGVWRVSAEIPAPSQTIAAAQFAAYVEAMQAELDKRSSATVVEKEHFRVDDTLSLVVFQTEDSANEALQATLLELQADSKRLDVSLDDLALAIEEEAEILTTLQATRTKLNRELAVLRSSSRLLKDNALAALPENVSNRYPAFEAVQRQLEVLKDDRSKAATALRPAHPQLAALDRRIQETQKRLDDWIKQLLENVQQDEQRLEDESNRQSAEILKQRKRVSELQSLKDRYEKYQQAKAAAPANQQPEVKPPTEPTKPPEEEKDAKEEAQPKEPAETKQEQTPVDESPEMREPGRLPPLNIRPMSSDKLLVAGPFIEAEPIRPTPRRDATIGAIAALIVGLGLVVVRAGADHRIHTPYHLEQLDLDIVVLGSVRELRGEYPVKISPRVPKA